MPAGIGYGGGGSLLSTFNPDGSGAVAFGPHRMQRTQASMPAYGTPSGRTRYSRMPGENSPLVGQELGDGPIANRQRTFFDASDDMRTQIRQARSTGGSTVGTASAQSPRTRRSMIPGRKLGIRMGGFGGTAGPAMAAPVSRSSANAAMGDIKRGHNALFGEALQHARNAEAFNRRTGVGTPRGRAPRPLVSANPNAAMGDIKRGHNALFGEALQHARNAEAFNRRTGVGTPRVNRKSTTSATRAIGGDVGKKAMRAGRSLGRTTASAAKTVGKGTLAVGGAVVGAPVLAVGAVGFGAYRGARKAGRAMAGGMRRSSSAAPITASPPTTAPRAPITASPPTTAPRAPMNPNASGGGLAAGTSAPSPKSARSLGGRTKGFLKTKSGKGLAIGAGAAVIGGLAYSGRRGEGSSGGRTGMARY